MATIKVFDSNGVRELKCFDTLDSIPYLEEDPSIESDEDPEDEE